MKPHIYLERLYWKVTPHSLEWKNRPYIERKLWEDAYSYVRELNYSIYWSIRRNEYYRKTITNLENQL